jgi:hypothetical protein
MEQLKEKISRHSSLDTTLDTISPDSSFILSMKEPEIQQRPLLGKFITFLALIETLMYMYTLIDY